MYQNPTFGIDFNMTDEELGIAEEEAEDMTAVMPAAPDTYYGAEEAYSEGDDEARARRMADKAQFAAALAGEIDIDELQRQRAAQNGRFPSAEAEDLLDDEDYDDEEEEEAEVSRGGRIALWIVSIFLFLVCIGAGIYLFLGSGIMKKSAAPEQSSAESSYETSRVVEAAPVVSEPMEEISEVVPEPEPEPEPEPVFTTFVEEPHYVASTDPANFDMEWEISKDGELVETYTREESISFGDGADYARVDGVLTFRGNNYRTDAAFGTTGMTKIEFGGAEWTRMNGGLDDSSGDMWSGIGWTGQPLIVRWDEDVRKAMTSMYEEKREKDGLVEVIYATMDGYIYFFDLEDGSKTRDSLWVGMTFKGAGALDPRGLPLMYVGSGVYNYYSEAPRAYIINLVDNSIVTSFGQYDSFAHRDWPAFDSSPIVNAETDTLIWPGENGILYTVKLNTSFNAATGEFTCEPDEPVRMRYTCPLSYERYYGVECSMTAFDHYGYYSDNAGFFFCVDLNTMEVIWLQDTNDDSNSTPIFEFDEKTGRGYLYTAPSLHWTKDYSDSGTVPIYKLDAITGEIIWKVDYKCLTITDISGGVQSSPAIGRPGTNLEGMIFYTIARIYREENPYDYYSGLMVALDTETGEEIWRWEMADYTWSSPVGVYTDDGKGYMIVFDSEGDGFLMDGLTGERMDSTSVGWLVEASPAVFEDRLVVGTRGSEIYCISLK